MGQPHLRRPLLHLVGGGSKEAAAQGERVGTSPDERKVKGPANRLVNSELFLESSSCCCSPHGTFIHPLLQQMEFLCEKLINKFRGHLSSQSHRNLYLLVPGDPEIQEVGPWDSPFPERQLGGGGEIRVNCRTE